MSETANLPQRDVDVNRDVAPPVAPSAKAMLRIVYIMGIVLVLLFVALIGGIIWKSARGAAPKDVTAAAIELGLAPGSAIQAMELDGDRVAIRTAAEIIVVDIRKNQVISRISLRPK